MRPEYVEAVEAARWGWLGLLLLLLPPIMVWLVGLSALGLPRPSRNSTRLAGFAIGVVAYSCLAVLHINHVQSVKEQHMQTDAEMKDWATDTHVVFAPFVQPIVAFVYCGLHFGGVLALSWLVSIVSDGSGTKRNAAEFMQ